MDFFLYKYTWMANFLGLIIVFPVVKAGSFGRCKRAVLILFLGRQPVNSFVI